MHLGGIWEGLHRSAANGFQSAWGFKIDDCVEDEFGLKQLVGLLGGAPDNNGRFQMRGGEYNTACGNLLQRGSSWWAGRAL